MKRFISVFSIFMVLSILLCGCDSSQADIKEDSKESKSALNDTWYVGGIYVEGKLIDVHDVSAVEDIYDSVLISFDEKGNFSYYNIYLTEGNYQEISREDGKATYILKSERFFEFDYVNEKFVERPFYENRKTQYIISMLDENTFAMWSYDERSGTVKDESSPTLYVKSDCKSDYIRKHKTDIDAL
ncbi:MAG: hypothetical protein E7546_04605 [Ruminococcaceae bacterium]|nr:hypothetical protein [Oscillospiraceae bacterium]